MELGSWALSDTWAHGYFGMGIRGLGNWRMAIRPVWRMALGRIMRMGELGDWALGRLCELGELGTFNLDTCDTWPHEHLCTSVMANSGTLAFGTWALVRIGSLALGHIGTWAH